MSNECCKELSGWCRAFTRVERALVVLETVLLVLLLALLVFLTMHMIVCSTPMTFIFDYPFITSSTEADSKLVAPTPTSDTATTKSNEHTINPKIKCSWVLSSKTEAATHYYFTDGDKQRTTTVAATTISDDDEPKQSDVSDGEEVNDERKSFVIALVKMKPPTDITFGCILTIISEYWVVTAASCIEAIEELDSLDTFVMMEEYGSDRTGQIHTIGDLQVHPFYQETNKSYDIAALRSEDSLLHGDKRPVEVVSAIDDALLALGERLHLLGYGAFRSIESGRGGRRVRLAFVYNVAARLCEAVATREEGTLRHLWGGRREGAGSAPASAASSRRPLCAGVLSARNMPCNYCAGAPLLLPARTRNRGRLLALMVDSPQCGVACEPNLYLPIVLVLDWIEHVLSQ